MSRADSLIERFIAVQQWPTSRKTALLCALILPPTAFNWAMANALWSRLDWVDMAYFDKSAWGMVAVEVLVGALAWEVGRRGYEGTWTFYLLAATFLPFLAMLIWGFGLFSSALLIFVPLTLLNVLVLFNGREGLVAIALATVWVSAGVVLALTEWIPYAPGLVAGQESHFDDWKYILAMGSISIGSSAVIFLVAFAEVTAARQTSTRLAAAQNIIARYLPAAVAEDILGGKHDEGHHRRKLTVFFSDLVGFSDIAEELEPEDLAMVLNEYFGEMTAIAHRHQGTVDELQGDALLILFGAPRATTDKEHALNAVRMAAEMHAVMDRLNAKWRDAGITEILRVRMGINTGVVTVGNFGTPERMKYAALGKHVNVAARLQAIATPGSTVISYATYLLVKDEVSCEALGPQSLKGITKPVEAFAV